MYEKDFEISNIMCIFATRKMRIVYIIDSLAFKGGAERIISEKMNALSAEDGYSITVITCYQFPQQFPNSYPLSDKVQQINLQIDDRQQYRYRYPKRLWVKWQYHRLMHRKLQETINRLQPDIIVSVGYRLADVVCCLDSPAPKVIEAHEARRYTMANELSPERPRLSRIMVSLYRIVYLRTIERHAAVVVCLTQEDAQGWHKARRVEVIQNFSSMQVTAMSSGNSKRVIAVGRLEWQKGYDRLIDIWKHVAKEHPDWQLDIFGEGALKDKLETQIQQQQVANIAIHPFTANISQEYANSAICVLTSYFEGFSLVLLEAMKHGVPCVTFDCPYGPRDVVADQQCGYVVKDGDMAGFARKLSELMEHAETRRAFAQAAIERAKVFDKGVIMQQWKALFASLLNKEHS